MGGKTATFGLRALSLAFLASAGAYVCVIAAYSDQDWAMGFRHSLAGAMPYAVAAGQAVDGHVLKPAGDWAVAQNQAFFDWWDPAGIRKDGAPVRYPVRIAAKASVQARPAEGLGKVPLKPGDLKLADQSPLADLPLPPAADPNPPSPAELARVMSHLKVSLTKELYENFALFLYVSKADHGPWAQRMYVFHKEQTGDLTLQYSWPVSTGREVAMENYAGRLLKTDTPPGYYQLDGGRMYKRYNSSEWHHPMPYAMFFNWEHDRLQTGLAIHSATGDDIQLLGTRASAGCVRLAPQNAAILYRLVRDNYKGLAPRFAYDRRTATMSKDGLLMHDASGKLQYAEGYKVLVFIENNGGDNIVAALF
jgi:hypothetical protein